MIEDAYGGSIDYRIRYARQAPKNDLWGSW